MNQTSQKTTQTGLRKLIKPLALFATGLAILFIVVMPESLIHTMQLLAVGFVSGVRGIKFLLQSRKDSRTRHHKVISLTLGINWLLLVVVGIIVEADFQFSIFNPAASGMWLHLLLLLLIALMFVNEGIFDFFRSQACEIRSEKRWFYWAIGGKVVGVLGLGLLFWFIAASQDNFSIFFDGVIMIFTGAFVWVLASLKQPKDDVS